LANPARPQKSSGTDDHCQLAACGQIARDYEGLGLPLLDLINEGNIGLLKGVQRR
jgi:DNA-directed RNA polymerase sigma subunit (sigma70/sigma32)